MAHTLAIATAAGQDIACSSSIIFSLAPTNPIQIHQAPGKVSVSLSQILTGSCRVEFYLIPHRQVLNGSYLLFDGFKTTHGAP